MRGAESLGVPREDGVSHEISMVSGKPEILYNGTNGTPWHGLGERLEHCVSPVEAARRVFPWTVSTRPIITVDGIEVPNKRAVIRDDARIAIGVVGLRHTLVQNAEFAQAVESLFGQAQAVIDVAGALSNGAKTFLLAKLPEGFEVRRDDKVERFFLAFNTHDGSGSVTLLYSSIRVCCANTLSAALGSASHIVRLRHTKNVQAGIDQAAKILARSEHYWSDLRVYLSGLANKQMTASDFEAFIKQLVPDNAEGETSPQAETARTTLRALFEGEGLIGADLDGGTTRWRALNVVTQYIDRLRPIRGDTSRLETSLFGEGAAGQLRQNAFDLLSVPSFS